MVPRADDPSDAGPSEASPAAGLRGLTGAIAQTLRAIGAVAANRAILRVVVAYGGFTIGEWGTWIAMLVYAFDRGGATAAGIVAIVQLIPAAILAPVAAGIGDRHPRERMLIASYVAQAATMAITAAALAVDAPIPVVYALAASSTVAVTLTRPAHGSILPSLARTPDELTSGNVASGTMQTLGILIAPALAGVLLAASGAGAVFAATAGICAVAAVVVWPVRTERPTVGRAPSARPASASGERERDGSGPGGLVQADDDVQADADGGAIEVETETVGLVDGLRVLLGHRGSRTIVLLIASGSVIEGALDVIAVVLALDLLNLGEGGVGLLGSAVGAGGLIGAASAAFLVGRSRLALPFALGLLLWSVPLAIVGALPLPLVAIGLFLVAGVGRSLMDIAGRTLLQRVAPDDALSGIFGALEGLHDVMLGVGSLAVPALIAILGPRPALVVAGLWLPVVVVLAWRALRAADDRAVVHVHELRLLRALPMFAALSPPTIERLSAHLARLEVAPGGWVIREGERGDRFYLIDGGSAEVEIDGRVVRTLGPGAGFGEIALIRDVARTASVRAIEPLSLFALERSLFVEAVTGHPEAHSTTDRIVREHLEGDRDTGPADSIAIDRR
jgi:MFS family permease